MPVSHSKTDHKNQSARDEIKKASEAGRHTMDETVRTARSVASEAAETGQYVTRAGIGLMQSGADTVQHTMGSSMSMAAQLMERSADQFAQTWGLTGQGAEKAAQESRRNMEAVAECGQVMTQRLQEISREWLSFAQERLNQNATGFSKLMRCRTPQDFVAVQSELMRDNLQGLMDGTRRIAEMSVQMSDEATRAITARANESASQSRGAG